MKKLILILVLLGAMSFSFGQSAPYYTQNIFNKFAINPATAGLTDCPDFKFGHRRQWMGLSQTPVTSFFTFNTSFGKEDKNSRAFHGFGARFITDQAGPFSAQSFHLGYAYHLQVNNKYTLSAGAFVGLRNYVYDGGSVVTPVFDPVVNATSSLLIYPEFDPGVYLYSKDDFFGFSVANFIPFKLQTSSDAIGSPSNNVKHYSITYGKIITAKGYYYTFIPSAMVRFTPYGVPSVDLNFMWYIEDNFALGASYRNPLGLSFIAEMRFLQRFRLGYAFDYGAIGPQGAFPFTHEVILSFLACKDKEKLNKKPVCPAYR
jgi:type IX secretion system PorP/SprF family membrane protein